MMTTRPFSLLGFLTVITASAVAGLGQDRKPAVEPPKAWTAEIKSVDAEKNLLTLAFGKETKQFDVNPDTRIVGGDGEDLKARLSDAGFKSKKFLRVTFEEKDGKNVATDVRMPAIEKLKTGARVVYQAPPGIKERGKTPLFVWFHGAGDTPENTFRATYRLPMCDKAVACALGSRQGGVWTDKDFAGLDEAVQLMKAKFPIDDKHVWLCGFSAGGFFAYMRLCTLPDDVEGMISAGSGLYGRAANFPADRWKYHVFTITGGKDFNRSSARALHDKVKAVKGVQAGYDEDPAAGHGMTREQMVAAYEFAFKIIEKERPKR